VDTARALAGLSIGTIGIRASDVAISPGDCLATMKAFARAHALPFDSAINATQDAARASGDVCAPGFFGSNAMDELQYRDGPAEPKTWPVRSVGRVFSRR
jgi:hypothetical protein